MIKKVSTVTMTLLLAASFTATSFGNADAGGGRTAAAIIGGAALGVLAVEAMRDREPVREGCYRGPRECRWVPGRCYWNEFDERVCRPGFRECYRPVVCD